MLLDLVRHDEGFGDVDGQHNGQDNPPDLQHEAGERRNHEEKIVVQQTSRLEVRPSWQQQVDQHTLREVEQMAQLHIRRDISSNSDIAATKDLQSIFVHLNKTVSCFAQALHGRIEHDSACLPSHTEHHLIKIDISHLRTMTLSGAPGGVSFHIATDLYYSQTPQCGGVSVQRRTESW
jgi:hypothetical protein